MSDGLILVTRSLPTFQPERRSNKPASGAALDNIMKVSAEKGYLRGWSFNRDLNFPLGLRLKSVPGSTSTTATNAPDRRKAVTIEVPYTQSCARSQRAALIVAITISIRESRMGAVSLKAARCRRPRRADHAMPCRFF